MTARLTADPETQTIPSGNTVTNLRVVTNNYYNKKENPVFVDVKAWGPMGESCQKYIKKGDQVTISGRLDMDSWEKEGEKRSKLYITADAVVFGSKVQADSQGEERTPAKKILAKAPSKPAPKEEEEDVPF